MSGLDTHVANEAFQQGSPELDSVGPITFSPDGVLFVADNASAQIVAVDLGLDEHEVEVASVENLDARLAAFLGCAPEDVNIHDLAVHPLSHAVFLPVTRGGGDAGVPLLIRLAADGSISEVELEDVEYATTTLGNAPAEDDGREEIRVIYDNDPAGEEIHIPQVPVTLRVSKESLRTNTVTDLAYVDGELLVAGASNEEFVSTFRRIPFPFRGESRSSTLEIYHVSHGKYETQSPIRTFTPYGDGLSIVASYTCTPIVHFPIAEFESGKHVRGRTVAELGNLSSPLDIVAFASEGDEYILVSNARRPLVKISCRDIEAQEGLTEPKEPVGVPREEVAQDGVSRMAVVNDQVLMLQRDDGGLHLRSYGTATL
jgi:hypothetical protein